MSTPVHGWLALAGVVVLVVAFLAVMLPIYVREVRRSAAAHAPVPEHLLAHLENAAHRLD